MSVACYLTHRLNLGLLLQPRHCVAKAVAVMEAGGPAQAAGGSIYCMCALEGACTQAHHTCVFVCCIVLEAPGGNISCISALQVHTQLFFVCCIALACCALQALRQRAAEEGCEVVVVSAKVESELNGMPAEEAKEWLEMLGVEAGEGGGLAALIRATYKTLGLQTYFTTGE